MNDLQWQLPGSFNFGRDVIDAIAGSHPDRLALIWCDQSGRERRYKSLDEMPPEMRRAFEQAARAHREEHGPNSHWPV